MVVGTTEFIHFDYSLIVGVRHKGTGVGRFY